MRNTVGISHRLKRAWLDDVLDRLVQTTDEKELRAFVDQRLQDELPGKESRAKASGITSDRGVALRVFDPDSPSRLDARTAALTGSGDWVPLQAEFEVRPETGLVQLQLCREPSWKFDNKLAGTIWIDDVELIRTR